MLFHVTHTHNWETCPYNDPARARDTFGRMMAGIADSEVELVAAFADAPAHKVFLVLEAESVVQIEQSLAPVIDMGSTKTRPVSDFAEILNRVIAED